MHNWSGPTEATTGFEAWVTVSSTTTTAATTTWTYSYKTPSYSYGYAPPSSRSVDTFFESAESRIIRVSRERTRTAIERFVALACLGWVPQWLRPLRGPVSKAPLVVRRRKRRTCSMADRYRVTN